MTKVRRVKFIFTKVNICFKIPVNLIKQLNNGENHVIFLNIFVFFTLKEMDIVGRKFKQK